MTALMSRRSLLDDMFGFATTPSGFSPALDVAEGDDQYIVRLDVPGVKAGDLNIEVRDNILTVRGHREWSNDQSAKGLGHVERGYGTFERSITLPRGAGDPEAKLADGVLTLHIAKPVEAQPRRIEIESADEPTTLEAGT